MLKRDFFDRKATEVAPDLLGKFLTLERGGKTTSCMITETEAYDGHDDRASHASKGKTARTEVMFGPPGHWYIYFIYGMYEMLNIVTGAEGYPSAVLIRGVESAPPAGGRRIDGPGKLTRDLGISRLLNTKPATKGSGLWIEDHGIYIPKTSIVRRPRIGVAYAGEWAKKPWRFVVRKR